MLKGKVIKYGDNIDTDVIIPARYLSTGDPDKLAALCMIDLDKDYVNRVKKGDIMVAGDNFGCGSSREHAPMAIKASGISCIIARSFARIFFRNAINIGLPILECSEAADKLSDGDTVTVDLIDGTIINTATGTVYHAEPFPPFLRKIIDAGGLINSIKRK